MVYGVTGYVIWTGIQDDVDTSIVFDCDLFSLQHLTDYLPSICWEVDTLSPDNLMNVTFSGINDTIRHFFRYCFNHFFLNKFTSSSLINVPHQHYRIGKKTIHANNQSFEVLCSKHSKVSRNYSYTYFYLLLSFPLGHFLIKTTGQH